MGKQRCQLVTLRVSAVPLHGDSIDATKVVDRQCGKNLVFSPFAIHLQEITALYFIFIENVLQPQGFYLFSTHRFSPVESVIHPLG